MKRKKQFGRFISLLLAAVMILTMLPADLQIKAYAAEVSGGDITAGSYAGPVVEGDGSVTFYYPGAEADAPVKVKGSWDWNAPIDMVYTGGVWSATVPAETLGLGSSIEYGFATGTAGTWANDSLNPNTGGGNSVIHRNPQKDASGNVTLWYYPAHGAYPGEVSIKYRAKDSGAAYATAAMTKDAVHTAVYSAAISGLADGTYEYYMDVDGTSVEDANSATPGEFVKSSYPAEDPSVQSPVAGPGEAEFYYYGPTATSVKLAGSMTSWGEGAITMTYNEATAYWYAKVNLAQGKHQYKFVVDGAWITDPLNASVENGNSIVTITEASNKVSPVIDGRTVRFVYENAAAEKVSVAGSMNGWTIGRDLMIKNPETGYWELTMELTPGEYTYKFVTGEAGWGTDPWNSREKDGNSLFYVAGIADAVAEVQIGNSTVLPSELVHYDEDGNKTTKEVTYCLSEESAGLGEWVSINKDAEQASILSLDEMFPAETKEFTLTAASKDGATAVVTVSVVEEQYVYTIYWYSSAYQNTEEADLWIWEKDGGGGTAYPFAEAVELAGGKTWLKAEVTLAYSNVCIIPRSYGGWTWQDSERNYNNEAKAEAVTLYLVEEDKTVYTELPEIVEKVQRYAVLEYTREDKKEEESYLYTWNSGYGSGVTIPFEKSENADIYRAIVPIKSTLTSLSFTITRKVGEDLWADKDGGDNLLATPEDQTVIRAKFAGGTITEVYPYNKGYEYDIKNSGILFCYREDTAFMEDTLDKFHSVKVEIDGTEYSMEYNAKAGRYEYLYTGLKEQDYQYRYVITKEETGKTDYLLDSYNSRTITAGETEYSVLTYKKYEAEVSAQVLNPSMDYNDNNVLSLEISAKEGTEAETIADLEITGAWADLSALGGASQVEIEPELMAVTFAVSQTVSAGEKVIPVTVEDQFGNSYTADAVVQVAGRSKGDDFDWDEAVIYFAVTDRFFDGNTKNNDSSAGYNTDSDTGSSSYHGGDFAGLTKKLDYLDNLGVNTIWITPIVANEMEEGLVTDQPGILSYGYHGYWASDFTALNSHLGTKAELKKLISEAHKRDMKIMVDVVLNHAGYGSEAYFDSLLEKGMIRGAEETVDGSDIYSELAGLPDFMTEREEVRQMLIDWQTQWVKDYDIDYFRVDTVKHVDNITWSAFKNALTAIDPEFKMIGEWSGAGYNSNVEMLGTGRMDSLLDFDFNDQAQNFANGRLAETEGFLRARNQVLDNTATLGSFMSSHDEDGLLYKLINENGLTEARAADLFKVAAALQITAKGQPVIYYGEEVGQYGANNYPYQTNRYDFDWSLNNGDNDMLNHYKTLLDIRQTYSEVFARGTRQTIAVSNDEGYDVFGRSYGSETLITALNIGTEAKTVILSLGAQPGNVYGDLYSNREYVVDADGNITIEIPAAADGGTAILKDFGPQDSVFTVEPVADCTYTGAALTPEITVRRGTTVLEKGRDYTLSWKNNKTVGTATVTVKGKGNYSGTQTTSFQIVKKAITDEDVILTYHDLLAEKKTAQKAAPKLKYGKVTLKEKTDYTVAYYKEESFHESGIQAEKLSNVKEAGRYVMVITATEKNYTGTVKMPVLVTEQTLMSGAKIKLEYSSTPYEEEEGFAVEKKPAVTEVKVGSKKLTVEQYEVSYTDNQEVGTASVTVTAKEGSGYIGSAVKTFKITGTKLGSVAKADAASIVPLTFNPVLAGEGQEQEAPGLAAKNASSGLTFAEGKDYTISYKNHKKAGTATIIFTGMGGYTGTISKTFKISPLELKDTDEKLVIEIAESVPYSKAGSEPKVTVTYGGILLEKNDYKLTWKNNKTVTTATVKKLPEVTVGGKGNYKGKAVKTFNISKAALSDMTVTVRDITYKEKAGNFAAAPVLKDEKGKTLTANKDYSKVFTYQYVNQTRVINKGTEIVRNAGDTANAADIVPADTAMRVLVSEKEGSSYTGSVSAEYRVVKADIAKASGSISAQIYTGKEITLQAEDFKKMKYAGTELILGQHYEIVSYDKNINKGTAKVTIKGIGDFGGTKTMSFKITTKGLLWWWNIFS